MSECGSDAVNVSPNRRVVLDAQALQYIKATVTKPILTRLQATCTAYEAYDYICKNFGNGRIQDLVDLHNKFTRLRFRPHFDPNRFTADFDEMIKTYEDLGTKFSEDYKTTLFLQKIDGIHDHTSPYSNFYSTVTSLPDENQTMEYIKERFVRIAEGEQNKTGTKRSSDQSEERKKKFHKKETDESRSKIKHVENRKVPDSNKKSKCVYTPEQMSKLRNMTKEQKKEVLCHNCGEYFHNEKNCPNTGKLCYKCHGYGHVKSECKGNTILLLVDSGASHHVINNINILTDYVEHETPQRIRTADKEANLYSSGQGCLSLSVNFGKVNSTLKLRNVQYVPKVDGNIISVSAFNSQFKTALVLYPKTGHIFSRKSGNKISKIEQINGLYMLRAQLLDVSDTTIQLEYDQINVNEKQLCLNKITKRNNLRNTKRKLSPKVLDLLKQEGEIWHRRMGHISAPTVNRLKNVILGANELICDKMTLCEICVKTKLHKKSFDKDRDRASRPCERIHVDLMGPIVPPTFIKNNTYIMCVTDDFSRYLQVFLLKSKTGQEVADCLNEALRFLQARYPGPGQFEI